jgi:hypothetical protein
METATINVAVSEPVQAFCTKYHLSVPLESALRLVEATFSPVRQARVDVETDPETDDQTLVIEVAVAMGVEEAIARKREYTRRWLEQSSAAVREKVRLVYDLVPQ